MIPIILAAVGGAIIGYSLREPKAPIEDKEENYPTTPKNNKGSTPTPPDEYEVQIETDRAGRALFQYQKEDDAKRDFDRFVKRGTVSLKEIEEKDSNWKFIYRESPFNNLPLSQEQIIKHIRWGIAGSRHPIEEKTL
ncbi:MAG: hypothetical protein IT273_14665 [Chitinophagales bacterium]|nr:hypothetical protein [Chitinophagales bacterium]